MGCRASPGVAHASHVLTLFVLVPVLVPLFGAMACDASTSVPVPRGPAKNEPLASSGSMTPADPAVLADLDRAERTLAASAGDCGAACGSLQEITAARVKLCAPRTDACDDAERKESDAQRSVLETCGECGAK